jgi:hypothetical protein
MKTGQCFIFHFNDEDSRGYFFTGIYQNIHGERLMVMCEMLPEEQLDPLTSFWKMSENFFNENLKSGKIELI